MYHCTKCDSQSLKWLGRCPECGGWGTLVDEGEGVKPTKTSGKKGGKQAKVINLTDVAEVSAKHLPTGIEELDRVLGGGLVSGSVVLLAGEPGIGKSTLVAQIASVFSQAQKKAVYYASGEESAGQIKLRFERLMLSLGGLQFSNEVDVASITQAAIAQTPSLLIIDSIQTMMTGENDYLAGSPTAVRAATAQLVEFAKKSGVPVLIIGQVTKDGAVAGPKTLEHLVDTVLTLEGDPNGLFRLLRASKNRFGAIDEVGVFEMTEKGLLPIANPSLRFLAEKSDTPGSVVTCIMEGNRPFLVEVQALVDKSFYPQPIRRTSGMDSGRLLMLLAILSKRLGISFGDQDVYVNVAGGMSFTDSSCDLAVAVALMKASKNQVMPSDTVIFGELGLGGEVRTVPFLDRRIKEIERLGFKKVVSPKSVKNLIELK